MKRDFTETKFYKTLEFVSNLICLNLAFVFTCVPVLTIGSSYSALYTALNSDMTVSTFFSSYRKNWKQSTLIWLILIVLMDLAFFNAVIVVRNRGNSTVLQILALVFSVFLSGMLFSWTFQLVALFDNKTKDILKNSVLLGFAHLPVTLALIALNLIFPVALVFFTSKFLQFGWIWFGFWFSTVAFMSSCLMKKAISKSTGVIFMTEEKND